MPKAGRFRYLEQETDPLLARAADLLACPPHLLDKDCLYRALSTQVLTVYPSELTRVTMYIAVKDFIFMGLSATRSGMSYASSSSAAGFAR